jgi:NAD-dependent SIR2 family protein deacetylase
MEPFGMRVRKVADLLKTSTKPIMFTGAGLSTNAGISDYRSGKDSKSKAGPGIYVAEDKWK